MEECANKTHKARQASLSKFHLKSPPHPTCPFDSESSFISGMSRMWGLCVILQNTQRMVPGVVNCMHTCANNVLLCLTRQACIKIVLCALDTRLEIWQDLHPLEGSNYVYHTMATSHSTVTTVTTVTTLCQRSKISESSCLCANLIFEHAANIIL